MILYDLVLSLGVIALLPKIFFKRKLPTFRQRLGLDIPDGKEVIWIHAVSVGEVKSVKGLLEKLKVEHPDNFILITTGTASGLEEAKRSLPRADAFCFFPIDFSWVMKKWVRALQPKLLIFVETDVWYNLLSEAKKIGTKTVLVSGKISERSANRYAKIPYLAKKLFSLFDLILVQNEEHYQRLNSWSEHVQIGGNLKLDAAPLPIDKEKWAPYFQGQNILISCTHEPEELELIEALASIPGTIYIAPRHPERYNQLCDLFESKQIAYIRWSQIDQKTGLERIVLIDSMGILPIFYSFCNLTIVAGSFSSHIGGHNILEPCLYGSPVFFGPSMHQQTELVARVLAAKAGQQSTTQTLAAAIQNFLVNSEQMQAGAVDVTAQSRGALEKTWGYLKNKNRKTCR